MQTESARDQNRDQGRDQNWGRAPDRNPESSRIAARRALALSAILFLIYLGNVLAGKLVTLNHMHRDWLLSDVSEFLVLLAATTCFVSATLLRERMRNGASHP